MILKNGKRLDGCSDTVPIGTINPYIGSVAPYGYLICEGQLVSKTTYKELYEICGDTFGTGTATEFYLPDLRGKTIVGYKEGDSIFGTLGGLLGSLTHAHGTKDHTLTVNEMPKHVHNFDYWNNWDGSGKVDLGGGSGAVARLNKWVDWTGDNAAGMQNAGGDKPHNHGDTEESSSLQPSITMNWIVKAFNLMPNQSYVENSLISSSEINALSAAKGKELNDKIEERLPIHGVFANNLDEAIEYPIYRSSVNPTGLPSYLGSNACMVLSSTNNSLYCGQLAFSFGSNSLALRRRYGSDVWTDWTYLNFDSVNNHLKDHGGCTITGGNITITYPSAAWQIMKFTGFSNIVNSNTNLFSLSGGCIKILKAGYYCVSATLEGDFNRAASIVICKNDKEVTPLIDGGEVGGMYNITCPNTVIKADANDVISLYTRCNTANASVLIRGERSCLTVTTI